MFQDLRRCMHSFCGIHHIPPPEDLWHDTLNPCECLSNVPGSCRTPSTCQCQGQQKTRFSLDFCSGLSGSY